MWSKVRAKQVNFACELYVFADADYFEMKENRDGTRVSEGDDKIVLEKSSLSFSETKTIKK